MWTAPLRSFRNVRLLRLSSACAAFISTGLLMTGCGEPKRVTYVDPNGPDTSVASGDAGEPFIRHGAAAVERSRACIGIRSALAVARTIAIEAPTSAGEVLDEPLTDMVPLIEFRASSSVPSGQLRSAIDKLRTSPPQDATAYSNEVRRITDGMLGQACDAVVSTAARQDISFRAGMLSETIQDAAMSYEEALDPGSSSVNLPAYRRAYGLIIDATTRQLEAIPEDARASVRATLESLSRSALSGPTPPRPPMSAEAVSAELATVGDDVIASSRIDTTMPGPDAEAPDRLRTLKRAVATAVEAYERKSSASAIEGLTTADNQALLPSASSIAAVSPSMLADLERGLLERLPATIRSGGDFTAAATELDSLLDEAIVLIEEELELLREEA